MQVHAHDFNWHYFMEVRVQYGHLLQLKVHAILSFFSPAYSACYLELIALASALSSDVFNRISNRSGWMLG
jgi:hypothetical protein